MAKEAVVHIRMDAELKKEAEELFRSMGTSFSEAVRMMAQRSVDLGALPFSVKKKKKSAFGIASKYANPDLIPLEEEAWANAVAEKYSNSLS